MGPWLPAMLLVVAACFSPQPAPGLPCAPAGAEPRCPSGQLCVNQGGIETCELDPATRIDAAVTADGPDGPPVPVPDARIDGSVNLDGDGDGVVDATDNCPTTANTDQADEDGDNDGDVCDLCPPYTDNSDPDGDGVGGPCDPDPSTGGNAIVAFSGFAAGVPAGWTATGGVSVTGGNAVFASGAAEQVLVMSAPVITRLDVMAAVTPTSFVASLGGIGVVQRRAPGAEPSVTCQLVTQTSGSPQALRLFDLDGGGTVTEGVHPVAVGDTYVLANRRDGNAYRCSATNPTLEVQGTVTFSPATPQLGLRVRNAGARYAWVLVVSRP